MCDAGDGALDMHGISWHLYRRNVAKTSKEPFVIFEFPPPLKSSHSCRSSYPADTVSTSVVWPVWASVFWSAAFVRQRTCSAND